MKKVISVLVTFTICFSVFSQVNKNAINSSKTNTHIQVFDQALLTGDVNTAITALNYYLVEQGSNSPYADSLAMIYMQQGAYAQCYFWANKRLQLKPEDNGLMEMKGICLEKLQQPKEAITIFEKLYGKTQNVYHGYKLMELQYSIKRLAECIATANSVEKLQFKPDYLLTYTVGDQNGRTYLQAGIFNIHGLALYDLDKKAEGMAYFERAVALDSNFVLARQNIDAIKTIEGNGKKADIKTPVPTTTPANKQN